MSEFQLQLSGVTKSYAGRRALDTVHLACEPGEFFVIYGPSGAGKSTLLKLIAGIESPDAGDVFVGGRDVVNVAPSRRNIAMAFESYALYPHLSVRDNLNFPLIAPGRHLSAAERNDRIMRVAELLEIDPLLLRRPYQLSGGQRQRVSLARALVRDAALTLLDEPIAHLDARLRHALRGELKHFQKERGATTIYATPDYFEAFTVADRIGVLIEGRLRQIGTPDEIYSEPVDTRVAALVGDPRMNMFGIDAQRRIKIGVHRIDLAEVNPAAAAAATQIGVRPGSIAVFRDASEPSAVPATVIMLDPIGDEAILGLEMEAEGPIMARAQLSEPPLRPGQQVWIRPDWRRAHYFDASGSRLNLGTEAGAQTKKGIGVRP